MAKPSPSNPLGYIANREYFQKRSLPKTIIRERLNCARNLFRKDLLAHYGCINAIEFSNRGDLLVSGGDDKRVLIWNVEQAVQGVARTVAMRWQHYSNIFCLGFDSTNSKVFSAGNDDQVIVHDIVTGEAVNFFLHEQPVYGLSIDPLNDNVFASACDNGKIQLYDIREPVSSEPFCLANYNSSFNAVMFNPVEPRILTTANSKEGVGLWDVRRPLQILLKYGKTNTRQSCMSVRFNYSGTHILALRRRLPPVLYAIHSPEHICQFDHPGYYNSCTMKTCCFAGEDNEFVLSGSDDFGLYMWRIPSSEEKDQWVDTAHMILRGHRSIVNQVRYNPSSCIIASSGVEKLIKLWSPFSLPESSGCLETEPTDNQRKIFSHEEYISLVLRSGEYMTHDYSHKSTKEDPRMMAFFDSLVQREIEGWTTDENASSEISTHENPGSTSESDSPLSDTPVTALTAALVEALEGQDNVSETLPVEPTDEVRETQPIAVENRISQLIARKRAQLMRLARSRNGDDVEILRPLRTRKLCLIENSSDSDSGGDVSIDADDPSNQDSDGTINGDVCETDYPNGRAGTSRSKNYDSQKNIDSRKRKLKYFLERSDSSDDDEDWYLQQKKKRKGGNWSSESSESDGSIPNDENCTTRGKHNLKQKGNVKILKESESDSDSYTSDSNSENTLILANSKIKQRIVSKTGKINHLSIANRSTIKPRSKSFHQKVSNKNSNQELLPEDSTNVIDDDVYSLMEENNTVPNKAMDKEALIECSIFNDEPRLTASPNCNSSIGTSFQEAETPDSGIASTSSPFSRPSSNSSLRSTSPQNKSLGEVGEASSSVIYEQCSNRSDQREITPNGIGGSRIRIEMSESDDGNNRNSIDSVSVENRDNSWMVFQRFRNRVNRIQRNYRKRYNNESDSN